MKSASSLLVCAASLLVLSAVGAPWAHAASSPVESGLEVWNVGYETYQVCPGDTVENVATRYGVTADRIRALNGLSASDQLAPGQSLVIVLPSRPKIYEEPKVQAPAVPEQPAVPAPQTGASGPRYASITKNCSVTSAIPPARGVTYYQLDPGMRIIVNGQKDGYVGVIMLDGSTGWIPGTAVQVSEELVPADAMQRMLVNAQTESGVVKDALAYMGTPYRLGGKLPRDVDCSLLVQTVFAKHGIRLPRTAAEQCEVGRPVNVNELQAGDRLYFTNKSGRISHTALYIGNTQFVHASSNRGCVAVDSLSDPHYWAMFYAARR